MGSSEEEMISLFELTPDLVCIANKAGFFKKINPAVQQKLGYTYEELYTNPVSTFIHPDDKQLTAQKRSSLLNGEALVNFQNRYLTSSGEIIWLEWTSIYIPDKEVVFAIAKDITLRKEKETEIEEKYKKFKSLATHFKSSIENDRKYLSIELHEELAQLASVIKMDLDWINTYDPQLSEQSKAKLEHSLVITELLIGSIRRISFSISPTMLDDLGLNATLKWLAKEFSILNSITCTFEGECDEAFLTDEVKLDFFRICQESLSNIMFHALAKNVKIRIQESDREIQLSIIDDGKGFDPEKVKNSPGLISMNERANSINGRLSITSQIDAGTEVCVSIMKNVFIEPFLRKTAEGN